MMKVFFLIFIIISILKFCLNVPQFGVPGGFGPPGGFLWRPSFQTLDTKPSTDYDNNYNNNNNYYKPGQVQYPSNYYVTEDPDEELKKYNYNKYNPYSSYNRKQQYG